jgi:Flp pilus assembly protein TadB
MRAKPQRVQLIRTIRGITGLAGPPKKKPRRSGALEFSDPSLLVLIFLLVLVVALLGALAGLLRLLVRVVLLATLLVFLFLILIAHKVSFREHGFKLPDVLGLTQKCQAFTA